MQGPAGGDCLKGLPMLARTSHTHPLEIAAVRSAPNQGAIGITFCPGKKQPGAATGAWDRELGLDLDAVVDFGAVVLVSLIEDHEIEALQVQAIAQECTARHLQWIHLPIADVSVPDRNFEESWTRHGPGLRARLRGGFNIVVHCKGGLGRAGTVAARLLIELGTGPHAAIRAVRLARPGAIETPAQLGYVEGLITADEAVPSKTQAACRDRALGALVGLAVGDAVGTTLEFAARGSYPPLTDMIGGGPFRLKPGQWTDDTAMALALADSLLACTAFDPTDLMTRFVQWRDEGAYSCTGTCFDIGTTVAAALSRWSRTGDPLAGSTDPGTAGNGSLMRLAPVAVRYWNDPSKLRHAAATQSRTTHAAPEAVSACVAWAGLLAEAIAGADRAQVLRPRHGDHAGTIANILAGSWRGMRRCDVRSSGFVAHSLEAALWSVGSTDSFAAAVLTAANLGGDADTTAAIAGQLAGALYGLGGIPPEWLGKLAWRAEITAKAAALFSASIGG